ncbi:MAG TPA: TcpQ domain-containing protein [Limnobacter sp.]|uniref:TcpQ domain-containing protein n=1 Tax=Limnobacter sp. TaxID=2003368 RepID=UPI002EDAB60F
MRWELRLDDLRLDRALARWAKQAGYSFRWDADRYLLIGAPSVFDGNFTDAIEQVLETPGIANSEYPLEACVYANNPPLLRITRLGDQARECQ